MYGGKIFFFCNSQHKLIAQQSTLWGLKVDIFLLLLVIKVCLSAIGQIRNTPKRLYGNDILMLSTHSEAFPPL